MLGLPLDVFRQVQQVTLDLPNSRACETEGWFPDPGTGGGGGGCLGFVERLVRLRGSGKVLVVEFFVIVVLVVLVVIVLCSAFLSNGN